MNYSFIANLSLRILAVYTAVQAVKNLPLFINNTQAILYMRNGGNAEDSLLFLLGIIPFLLLVCVGIFLWVNAEKISAFILRKQNSTVLEEQKELQVTLFSVVGLLVIVQTLPQWFNLIPSLIFMTERYQMMGLSINAIHTYTALIGLLVQVCIGLYLFLGARGLAGVLKLLRKH